MTDTVTITLGASLWDARVDSIGSDFPDLKRHSDRWSYVRVGFGGRVSADVDRKTAEAIASYLDSVSGLMSQGYAMDAEDRADARREAASAASAAATIRSRTASAAKKEQR